MSKETLHGLIDMLSDADAETIYNVLIRFIPEDKPENDELKAIAFANEDIRKNGTIPHSAINWD